MEYVLNNRTLFKSEDGTLKSAEQVRSSYDIDYMWLINEPGIINLDNGVTIVAETSGVLIKTYPYSEIPSRVFMMYNDELTAWLKEVEENKKKNEKNNNKAKSTDMCADAAEAPSI